MIKAADFLSRTTQSKPDVESYSMLGHIYFYGNGVEPNDALAASYLGFAAEQGNINAQVLMAHLYYYGRGVKQDYAKAVHFLSKGVSESIPAALSLRGRMYYYGDGHCCPKKVEERRYNS